MTENYICPCCSFKGVFSEALANRILYEICQHYSVYVESIRTKRKWRNVAKAKSVFCYVIVKFTGASSKEVSSYLKLAKTYGANEYRMECIKRIATDAKEYHEVEMLMKKIISKINLLKRETSLV